MHAPETDYAFDKDLTTRLRDLRAPVRRGLAKWHPRQMLLLAVIFAGLGFLLTHTSNRFEAGDPVDLVVWELPYTEA